MTANAFEEDVEKTKAAGMTAHLTKPIQVDVLCAALAGVYGRERKEDTQQTSQN
jgi:CheY-like chemotaxis protein